ncbi:MAG: non-ribosomal peptide synthetase, partial [bacterium]|nr:non-ribosomal peptide synthetase [bacterium]
SIIDNELSQLISPALTVTIPVIDLRDLSPEDKNRFVHKHILEEFGAPFDLSCVPLLRVTVLKLSETEHVLIFVKHHIITDWFSYSLFLEELSQYYDSLSTGNPITLPDDFVQFADFALWQLEYEKGEEMARSLSYWKEHLRGASFQLDLPFTRPRPPLQTYAGKNQPIRFSRTLVPALKQYSRRQNATLFMTLTAAFQLLLFRYTRQQHIIISTPIANRKHAELEKTLGFLLNLLPFCTDFSGNPGFGTLLGRVRQVILDAYRHQDLPFGTLVENLDIVRDPSRNPVFQFSFIFLEGTPSVSGFQGLKMEALDIDPEVSRFDITLVVREDGIDPDGMSGHFEYNTDLYDEESMISMAHQFETLRENIVRHSAERLADPGKPEQSISQYPLFTEAEQRQLLDWSQTESHYPQSEIPDRSPAQ